MFYYQLLDVWASHLNIHLNCSCNDRDLSKILQRNSPSDIEEKNKRYIQIEIA